MARPSVPPEIKFWKNIDKSDGCWLWTGYKGKKGYGYTSGSIDGKQKRIQVHRLSYEIHFGAIPQGLQVLHKCDVPLCVRPDHLFIGDDQANRSDMASKGRGRGGKSTLPMGVRERKIVRPWSRPFRAELTHFGRYIYLGRFYTVEAAAAAVAAKKIELYGE